MGFQIEWVGFYALVKDDPGNGGGHDDPAGL